MYIVVRTISQVHNVPRETICPSTSEPPGQNPPKSHTRSQSCPVRSDPGSAPSSPEPSPATAAPPSHSDPPTAPPHPSSARPARSAHSPPAPDPPASPLTSFPPSPAPKSVLYG